ncbi:DUF427 domain-containing protein [Paraconexibacter sp.]|uniref:DUF427 domain-containing protein n=1 Tax=Paraconexibacter sp. TaxID=2949640 RepID=UPI0035634A95
MGLTKGAGPLAGGGRAPSNFSLEGPAHQLHLEPYPRRLRVVVAGRLAADTLGASLLMETGLLPVAYVPFPDVDRSLIERTDTSTSCPFKGECSYWSVAGVPDALWAYEHPIETAPWLAGLAAFDRFKIEHFLVEEDRVFGPHLRDPYTRVDVHDSARTAVVTVAGVEVARTRRPRLLFETGHPVRVYVPPADVAIGALVPSSTRAQCPYKGESTYWHVRAGDRVVQDACWSYETPLPEAARVQGHAAFAGDEVEIVLSDR